MYLIYDIFTNILKFTDIHTEYQLCFVDKTLYRMCSKIHHLIPIIHNYSHVYRPYVQSDILDGFLNDLSGNDDQYLSLIQTTFGSLLNEKRIILLTGSHNGKSTFMYLIKRIFDVDKINDIEIEYTEYESGKIVLIDAVENLYLLPDRIYLKNSTILINWLTYLDDRLFIDRVKRDNHVITIQFKTRYISWGNNLGYKSIIWNMSTLFDNKAVSAFFNFLLDGYIKNIKSI
jgi:hypothetical protein